MPSKVTTKTKRTIKTAKRKVAASRKLKTTRNMVGRAPAGTMDQLVGIEIRNLDSELIRDITYSNGDLVVTFRSGGLYRYLKIDPKMVMELLASKSYGRYFNENIRSLPCERLA